MYVHKTSALMEMHGRHQKGSRCKPRCLKKMNENMRVAACPYLGVDLNWAETGEKMGRPRKTVRHLAESGVACDLQRLGRYSGVDYV